MSSRRSKRIQCLIEVMIHVCALGNRVYVCCVFRCVRVSTIACSSSDQSAHAEIIADELHTAPECRGMASAVAAAGIERVCSREQWGRRSTVQPDARVSLCTLHAQMTLTPMHACVRMPSVGAVRSTPLRSAVCCCTPLLPSPSPQHAHTRSRAPGDRQQRHKDGQRWLSTRGSAEPCADGCSSALLCSAPSDEHRCAPPFVRCSIPRTHSRTHAPASCTLSDSRSGDRLGARRAYSALHIVRGCGAHRRRNGEHPEQHSAREAAASLPHACRSLDSTLGVRCVCVSQCGSAVRSVCGARATLARSPRCSVLLPLPSSVSMR